MMEDDKEPVYASKAKPWLKYYDEKYIHQSVPECSAFALVCRNNERHLGDTALEYYGRKFSYADLIVQIKKTAAALQALGVKKGDIITVVSVMTPEVVYTFYAADLLGATLNLVDPRYSAEGIREYIEEVESRLLICLNVVYPRCHQAAKRTSVERVVVLSPADSLPLAKAVGYKLTEPDKNRYASNVLRWKAFIAAGKGHSPAAVPYDPQHTCVVVHTGGTTGSPKGVMLTDYCFNALAQEFAAQSRLFHRGQKLLNVMPPFIAYGYSCGIHMPLVMGLHIIIIPNLDPEKLGALVWKYKPAHMFGVPTHYQQLAADPLLKNKDLSFIRNYAAGGDSLSLGAEQTVNRFLKAHGVEYPLAKGYGMTEVSSAATIAAGNVTKPGSVGIPMVNTVVSIFEPGTETELPIGQRGEICICTPTAMKGYYNKPEETAYLLRRHADGQLWAHTGDIGSMDEDGFVYLDARIKRIIIRHDGFKVFPSMIENVISRHPAVHQCCVVGCADTDHTQGRLPFVFVVLEPAATGKKRQILRELRQLCCEELPEYVQPAASAYKIIPEMPLTPAGKADYRKLEEEVG
ncbi:MAG: class I adenylate-forming enzyme family protein [Faecalibacterium prausnitzii]